MSNIKILGVGHALPDSIVTNDDLSLMMETNDEWIRTRTGIKERRIANDSSTSNLALKAALIAIEDAKINKNEIDIVICATITPDNSTPAVSQMVIKELQIEAMAFDISAACSGFVYALTIASSLLETLKFKKALVIGAEILSKIIDFSDRNTAILFGDGAGAFIIDNTGSKSYSYCMAKGDNDNVLYAHLFDKEGLYKNGITNHFLKMDGQNVFKFALFAMEDAITQILKITNKNINDIDLIIPHQANYRIIESVKKKMNIASEKFFLNLESYGNTSAASIAIAYSEAKTKGIIKPGMKMIFVGFGAGLTWASIYLEV